MLLSKLFKDYKDKDLDINSIKTSSKDVKPGDLFVCIKGAKVDRHDFIKDAIDNGAIALVVSKDIDFNIPYIKVEDTNKELVRLLKVFYDNPQDKLTLIGITGTDGKTTSAKIIQQLIGNDKCGYIGTLGIDCKYFKDKTTNTTPTSETLFYYFDKFFKLGIKYVALETSSEAFFYNRLEGINFNIGCLTNITSEHLNTHKTLENYIYCKKQLFLKSKKQILNSNDLHFSEIKEISNNYQTYGYKNDDTLKINDYKLYPNKTDINVIYQNQIYLINSSLLCKFNVENLSLALLVCLNLGFDINELLSKMNKLVIPGRMQVMDIGQNFYCIVDYAHTANAVKNVLEFANTLNVSKITTVIGQAGGRDPFKRKEVGKFALELSDYVYLTSDDPRFEDPQDICRQMLESTNNTNYEIIIDRSKAIEKAILNAKENELIMCLGKGVDPYQKVKDYDEYYLETEEVIKSINKKLGN